MRSIGRVGLAAFLFLGASLAARAAEIEGAQQQPSANITKRLKEDYRVVHSDGRLLDLRGDYRDGLRPKGYG
jgi:hypothetical protein